MASFVSEILSSAGNFEDCGSLWEIFYQNLPVYSIQIAQFAHVLFSYVFLFHYFNVQ